MSIAAMKARVRSGPGVWISVHRAAWGPLPENSLAAIRTATRWEVIEIDAALDAEGRAFLMHDDTLERMTGNPAETDGADPALIASLWLREGAGGAGARVTGEPIPRLDEALAAIAGTGAIFDVDVKREKDVPAVAAQIAEAGGQDRATVKIAVEDAAGIAALKALEAEFGVLVMAKVDLHTEADLALIEALREADQAQVEMWFADMALLEAACRIGGPGLRIGTYTLDPVHCCGLSDAAALKDPDAVWGRLKRAGIGQIMTDRREELSAFLGR